MTNTKGWMPETIGGEVTVLYWEVSELLVPLMLVVIGTISEYFKIFFCLNVVYFYFMSKYKDKLPKGFGINFLYLLGLLPFSQSVSTFFASHFHE